MKKTRGGRMTAAKARPNRFSITADLTSLRQGFGGPP
jgi:hypothetical protein